MLTRAWTMDAVREPALTDRERKDIFVVNENDYLKIRDEG